MQRINLRNALILSFALHIFFASGTWLIENLKPKAAEAPITFEILENEDFQKLEKQMQAQAESLSKQIVDQDLPESKEAANTRFMSEKNQIVEKQTVARNRGEFKNAQSDKKAGTKGEKQSLEKTAEAKDAALKNLFSQYDPAEGMKRQQELYKPQAAGEGGQNGQGEVSQTQDYIKDVDQGLQTLLNTREFKYYSYYSRIRKQLAQHWEGEVRERLSKMFREGRSPAATSQDRITKVIVVLNSAGTLVRVQLLADSGVKDLDDAAIEAFRAAAPFPNPPAGIVEEDGTVKIRWDFVLES